MIDWVYDCEREKWTRENEAVWAKIGLPWDWRGEILELRKSDELKSVIACIRSIVSK